MTTTNVSQIKFNKLSENQYEATTPVDGEFYITPCPTYALDSEAVHKTGNETINGTKTFNEPIIATIKAVYGGFEYASAYSSYTIKYGRLASILINGTY